MAKQALRVVSNEESELGKPLPVPLSRVFPMQGQPRRYFNPATTTELADDIQENGQDTPVVVCVHSSKPGCFVLIGGERRWRAFHIIAKRTGTDPLVDCRIDTVNDERHHFRKAFRDNIQREDLIARDEADSYLRMYKESTGETHRDKVLEVAREARKGSKHIENYLCIAKLPDSVKDMMNPELLDKQLVPSIALEIARSTTDPKLQLELAQESIDRVLGIVEARTLVRQKTGNHAYGLSGRPRVPADDYKAFKNVIGSLKWRSERTGALRVDDLYKSRPNQNGDRIEDAKIIEETIRNLTELLKKVRKT